MHAFCRVFLFLVVVQSPVAANLWAQAPASSGTFVLHKFARAIGKETYTIDPNGDRYTLHTHFLFTDRGTPVPLEVMFTARKRDMVPVNYTAKGKSSRLSAMDDVVTVAGDMLTVTRSGKTETEQPAGPWFITDGYSPVAMQEQMMRWWLGHGSPAEFTVYPAGARVHIHPAAALTFGGQALRGFTVDGLIWGGESLWLDSAQNLAGLVSTDSEFDHFEAVREPYAADLGLFIAAAVKSNLAALETLSASARTAPAHRLAITGATLIDSTGAPPVPDSVILIEDGVIAAAGPRSAVKIPNDAIVLDATGKYAIPGLWDMHAHYEQVEWGPIYLAAGVTSVRDCGNEFDFLRTLHDALDRKRAPAIGPHLEFAGVIDGEGPLTLGAVTAITPDQARGWVERYKRAGARQIKIYSSVSPEVVKAITADAHARGLTVTGHVPEAMDAVDAVDAGMDQINHIQYAVRYFGTRPNGPDGRPDRTKPFVLELDGPRAKSFIATLRTHGTVFDPTMAIYEAQFNTVPLDQLEPGVDHLPPQVRAALDSPPATGAAAATARERWQVLMATLRALHAAGIPIVAGTDQTIPGYSLHRELELYVEAGFTPLEALQSATLVAARALGVEQESGSLEPGRRGDVLLLDADPLADIHNTRRVWRTVAAGAVYDPAPLWKSVGFLP